MNVIRIGILGIVSVAAMLAALPSWTLAQDAAVAIAPDGAAVGDYDTIEFGGRRIAGRMIRAALEGEVLS